MSADHGREDARWRRAAACRCVCDDDYALSARTTRAQCADAIAACSTAAAIEPAISADAALCGGIIRTTAAAPAARAMRGIPFGTIAAITAR